MIKTSFVEIMEITEREAKHFFKVNRKWTLTPEALIEKAGQDGYLDDEQIDADLFRHLMKKYHYQIYKQEQKSKLQSIIKTHYSKVLDRKVTIPED